MEAADSLTLGMFVTLAALIVGSIWNQHRESNAIRAETTRQLERLSDHFGGQLRRLSEDMANIREKLARIEGHLGLAPLPTDASRGDDDRDSG
jgi:hypothetical protein